MRVASGGGGGTVVVDIAGVRAASGTLGEAGQAFGLVVAPRFEGDDLTGEVTLPVYARLFVPLPDGRTDYAAWVELVATREDAERIYAKATH
ncbi:MAG TPA: hypothetical protein VGQ38_06750 [Gaiellaceae bacterium]|jgi:hypothetical protein|nr:hypothetical protein [Gaiellaceae bacterium]